jgi:hypothetical protein
MSKVSISQVTDEIFNFINETGYTYVDMFAVFRGFIHSECERDSAVFDRLKQWLLEVKESH